MVRRNGCLEEELEADAINDSSVKEVMLKDSRACQDALESISSSNFLHKPFPIVHAFFDRKTVAKITQVIVR